MDVPAFVVTHHVPDGWPRPGSTIQFVTDGIEGAVARAKSAAGPKSVGVHGAQTIQQCLDAGLLDEIHIDLAAVLLGAGVAVRPPREHTGRPRESDGRHRCGCHASALSSAHVVDQAGDPVAWTRQLVGLLCPDRSATERRAPAPELRRTALPLARASSRTPPRPPRRPSTGKVLEVATVARR